MALQWDTFVSHHVLITFNLKVPYTSYYHLLTVVILKCIPGLDKLENITLYMCKIIRSLALTQQDTLNVTICFYLYMSKYIFQNN